MIDQKTVVIKDRKYLINMMDGWSGISVGRKIAKIIGPAIFAAIDNDEEVGLSKAVEVFLEHIDEFDNELIGKLMQNVTRDGVQIKVENEFKGNYGVLIQLLKEVVMFNFADLFTEGLGASNEEKAAE